MGTIRDFFSIKKYCSPVKLLLFSKIRADTSHEVSALLVIFDFIKKFITVNKVSHFSGQLVYSQVLKLVDKY